MNQSPCHDSARPRRPQLHSGRALDGDNVVQESSGSSTTNLLQGPGTDTLLQRGSNWVLHGELNHVSVVTDAGGGSDEWCYYEPWGQMTA